MFESFDLSVVLMAVVFVLAWLVELVMGIFFR